MLPVSTSPEQIVEGFDTIAPANDPIGDLRALERLYC
jgi:hypothetical protein